MKKRRKNHRTIIFAALVSLIFCSGAFALDKEECRRTFPNWEIYANGAVLGLNIYFMMLPDPSPSIDPPDEDSLDYELSENHSNLNNERFGTWSDSLLISLVLAPPATYALSKYVPAVGIKSPELKFLAFLETMNVNEMFTDGTKKLVGRERPDGSDNESFISGHSSSSFAAASFFAWDLSATLADKVPSDAWVGFRFAARATPFALLYTAAGLTAYYRIAAEKHYFTDVLAGGLTGAICGNAIYLYHFDTNGEPRNKKSPTAYLYPAWSSDYRGVEFVYYF